jgi:hypothetical protein
MNFEKEIAIQKVKRNIQQHFAEEHGEVIPLDEIELIEIKPRCQCNSGLEERPDGILVCPKCGVEGVTP